VAISPIAKCQILMTFVLIINRKQIDRIYNFFKSEVEGKGIQFSFKNAIKYSEKGSIEFGYNKKGECLEFFVKDTGIGIPRYVTPGCLRPDSVLSDRGYYSRDERVYADHLQIVAVTYR